MKNNTKKKKLKTADIVYIGIFAAIIAACSWISIPIGAVPVTLQTMAVCTAAGLLGRKRGTLSIIIYILIGIIGIPVFAGFSSGAGYVFGATGGYLLGFIFTSLIIGSLVPLLGERWRAYFISMLLGISACYIFGTVWFMLVYGKGGTASLSSALAMCVAPFIIPDIVKAAVAATLCVKLNKFLK